MLVLKFDEIGTSFSRVLRGETVAKWVKRFRVEGVEGLRDRSSRPIRTYDRMGLGLFEQDRPPDQTTPNHLAKSRLARKESLSRPGWVER